MRCEEGSMIPPLPHKPGRMKQADTGADSFLFMPLLNHSSLKLQRGLSEKSGSPCLVCGAKEKQREEW